MNTKKFFYSKLFYLLCLMVILGECALMAIVTTVQDVDLLFPKTVAEIESRTASAIAQVDHEIQRIVDIPQELRTFDNTARAFDHALMHYHTLSSAIHTLEMVSPDANIREAAHQAIIKLQSFSIHTISYNQQLYKSLKSYANLQVPHEKLTDEERYFIHETIKDFEKSGLNLPGDQQEKIKQIKQELGQLSLQFQTNINNDNRTISVPLEDLKGVNQQFIDSLKKDTEGLYILGVDYPTYHMIMENCSIESTRKALWLAFVNRAYPKN
ncbi:MAG TPA: hypothetical protein VHA52_03255, partial [Candidatus Babeliaceae bacterium]|nr:hypothetical protein [Candidatus Babeliaceae bacterium]